MDKQEEFERAPGILKIAKERLERDGELEIDDDAKVSEGDDNGAYVQAWVWVDLSGTKFCKDPDTCHGRTCKVHG